MDIQKFEKAITKTGIISLAILAVIGIAASLLGICETDIDAGEFAEWVFCFVLSVSSIVAAYCIPVSFLLNLSSIAASLIAARKQSSKCTEDNVEIE